MSAAITGVVTNGVIVPSSPLPEGAKVEIRLQPAEVTPELQEEFDDWERAGAGTLEMVERLGEDMTGSTQHVNPAAAPQSPGNAID